MLAAELVATELAGTKIFPQMSFGIGLMVTEVSGELLWFHTKALTPSLSRHAGEGELEPRRK